MHYTGPGGGGGPHAGEGRAFQLSTGFREGSRRHGGAAKCRTRDRSGPWGPLGAGELAGSQCQAGPRGGGKDQAGDKNWRVVGLGVTQTEPPGTLGGEEMLGRGRRRRGQRAAHVKALRLAVSAKQAPMSRPVPGWRALSACDEEGPGASVRAGSTGEGGAPRGGTRRQHPVQQEDKWVAILEPPGVNIASARGGAGWGALVASSLVWGTSL